MVASLLFHLTSYDNEGTNDGNDDTYDDASPIPRVDLLGQRLTMIISVTASTIQILAICHIIQATSHIMAVMISLNTATFINVVRGFYELLENL